MDHPGLSLARIATGKKEELGQEAPLWVGAGIAATGAVLSIAGALFGSVMVALPGITAAISRMIGWVPWLFVLLLMCPRGNRF